MSATRPTTHDPAIITADLVSSFEIELKAARRSQSTQRIYLSSIRLYTQWCDDNGLPRQIDRAQVARWMAELLDNGAMPTTVAARLAGVRQLSKWMTAEDMLAADPLLRLNAPKADMSITPV